MKKWIPHNYQLTAASFLICKPCSGLFLDPGLGKTSTSLAVINILKNLGEIKGVLLIAPLKVVQLTWPDEIQGWVNFQKLSYTILHGSAGKKSLHGPRKDIYLMNPEGLPWLFKELYKLAEEGKKIPFNTLWIDESTKFKSPNAKTRFKTLQKMLPLFERRHIMTGTPAPRNLLDLWSQISILDNGEALGRSYYQFRNKFFMTKPYDPWNYYPKDETTRDKIYKLISPLVLEMSAKDYLDMPEITYNNIKVQLSKGVLKQYKKLENDFFMELDSGEITAEAAAQASMKCHQVANGRVYEDIPPELDKEQLRAFKKTRKTFDIHKAKIESLQELIDELNGKPLLVAYHYRHDLEAIQKHFGKVPFIGSGVKEREAVSIQNKWNAGKIPLLLGQPSSMGHGLNLQKGGNDLCWYSQTWNLEHYLQFTARIYRQGVSGAVRIHHLVAQDTIDEAMLLRLGDKAKEQTDLRQALKQYRKKINLTSI